MLGELKRLLWADDEPDRLEYEAEFVMSLGSRVDFAKTLLQAVDALRQARYDGLILDQMFPVGIEDGPNIWGGCLLLRWLRRIDVPNGVPEDLRQVTSAIWTSGPLEGNESIPVHLVSAFYNPSILALIRESEQNAKLRPSPKPTDTARLKEFFHLVESR